MTGCIADVEFNPHDIVQDLHNALIEAVFFSTRGAERMDGSLYSSTLMPRSRQLLFTETIGSLPLTPVSIIEVGWLMFGNLEAY